MIRIFTIICGLVLALPNVVVSEEIPHLYGWATLGSKDEKKSGSLGVRGMNWGIEIGYLQTADYKKSNINEYPVPHNDYKMLGTKNIGDTSGVDLLKFWNFNKNISLYGGIGVYQQEKADVAQSNVTGWLYEQRSSAETTAVVSTGLHYASNYPIISTYPSFCLIFGIGYHSIRGANFNIGIGF